MPNFHETPMGRRFYERDVPELIEALKSIAASLKVGAEIETEARQTIPEIKDPADLRKPLNRPPMGGPDILPHRPK